MRDLFIISGGDDAPILLNVKDRLGAAQAFEAHRKSKALPVQDLAGNAAFRRFIEGEESQIRWGKYRLDAIKENK